MQNTYLYISKLDNIKSKYISQLIEDSHEEANFQELITANAFAEIDRLEREYKVEANKGFYIWRTRGDNKVRSRHAALDGKIFSWNETPPGGYHPGEDFGCRCKAEPISNEHAYEELGKPQEIEEGKLPRIEPEEIIPQGYEERFYQKVVTSVNDLREWLFIDFGYHYKFGGGKEVTLEQIGFLEKVIKKSKSHVFQRVENEVSERARKLLEGTIQDNFRNSYSFHDVSKYFGEGTIYGDYTITVTKIHTENGYSLNIFGIVEYNYTDSFTDIFSEREKLIGTSSPDAASPELLENTEYGSPFSIIGNWKTEITGIIKVRVK